MIGDPTPAPRTARWARALVFAGLAVVCFWKLGAMPLQETDEGFAANRAASFERHGTWRLAFDDVNSDEPQFHKPLLMYWAVATLYRVVGYHEWAVRLPTAFAGWAACWLLYLLHRRALGEWAALGGAVLFCATPFITWHIRTAMLELPLLALALAAIYALAYRDTGRWNGILAGLAAGGAILLKGMSGGMVWLVAAAVAMIRRRWDRALLADVAAALATAVALFGLYVLTIPPEYRYDMIQALFLKEGTHRFVQVRWSVRFIEAFVNPLRETAWPLFAPAAIGLAVAGFRTWRDREMRKWLALAVLMSAPIVWVGLRQVVPYPRYFIPVYPWLAALAAFGLCAALKRPALSVPVLAALVALTMASPSARDRHPRSKERPYPGLEEVARRVPEFVPPGERIIFASKRQKCHQLLFYGRRAVIGHERWLLQEFRPGETRFAVVLDGAWTPIPLVETEPIFTSDLSALWRLHVREDRPDVAGVLLCPRGKAREFERKLQQRGQPFERFDGGFYLLRSGA